MTTQWYHIASNTPRRVLMPDELAKPFDVYVDQFTCLLGPYGAALNFNRTAPTPAAPGTPPRTDAVGTVRMSMEHLKGMVFIIKRLVDEVEGNEGVAYPLSMATMNQMQIAPEDWETFWGGIE